MIAALIIGLTAVALLRVILHLRHVQRHARLGHRRRAQPIADRTSTVPEVVPSVNANLTPVRDVLRRDLKR